MALLAGIFNGDEVRLVRDYENQYDPNAVEVRTGGELLGFIPRTQAPLLAPRMDAGATTSASVVSVERNQQSPQVVVEISIELNSD